jgi:acetyl esterase/lipase
MTDTSRTVRYGDGPEQVADVRLPPGDPVGPLVIFIHGGFWKAAYDRHHAAPLAADLAGRGYPVASIEYRRVGQPGGGWPGTFDDVAAAVARVPGLVGADTGRPVLAGHSAGGHLALWAAARIERVGGTVALAPVADLALGYRLGLGDGAVAALLGGSPAQVPDRYAYGEPGRPAAPTVIVHGAADDVVPVELSRAYVRRYPAVELAELPGVDHMAVIDPESTAWPAVLRALAAIGT